MQQRGTFSLKGFLSRDVVAYLNINFFTASLRNKVDFFLIELADINIVSTAQKLDADHVFIDSAVVHISASEDRIADAAVTQIELFGAFKILLATNIVSFHIIEHKGVAQILDILADGYVVGRGIVCRQQLTNLVGRSQIADIVHQELTQPLQYQSIGQSVFLHQISGDDGFIDFFDIVCSVLFGSVGVGACQTTLDRIIIKELILVANIIKILAILLETERQHMNFNVASGKQRCQICAQQESVGAGHINIVFALGVKAVDRQLKLGAHLHFIHKQIVCFTGLIAFLHIGVQRMVFLDFFIGQIHEVNEDNIDVFKIAFQVLNIRLHQLGFTGSADACDDLDVGSTVQFNDSIEIFCSRNCFHRVTRFQKLKIFHFSKSC